ncbi:hypothetical protein BpHYR1_021888 [Brachionus plicatilis]|uniref:Uncharacterized protein n=1 Tax=Brachionus plicatilis TaxID=10195 RepID=A0A3M7SMP5_BRAPC|nr:hypothetical protein BpHYR1_021888 [Brachionus plicatilis]
MAKSLLQFENFHLNRLPFSTINFNFYSAFIQKNFMSSSINRLVSIKANPWYLKLEFLELGKNHNNMKLRKTKTFLSIRKKSKNQKLFQKQLNCILMLLRLFIYY